ncbi:hypothetical protein HGA64_05320 [Candidatus Falkowbacteria bacterium]|nr:hypothetical protein [Candidatus Falkowbacteria bacterium]
MERSSRKLHCISPAPLLMVYTGRLQMFALVVSIFGLAWIVLVLVKKLMKKEKVFDPSFFKFLYLELALWSFAFFPATNQVKYIFAYPALLVYLLVGHIVLSRFKVFKGNKRIRKVLLVACLLALAISYYRVKIVGIDKATNALEATDGVQKNVILRGCGSSNFW